jgi:hypothetical protein
VRRSAKLVDTAERLPRLTLIRCGPTQRCAAIHACCHGSCRLPSFSSPFPPSHTHTALEYCYRVVASGRWWPVGGMPCARSVSAERGASRRGARFPRVCERRSSCRACARTNRCLPHSKYDGGSRLTQREERKHESLGRRVNGRSRRLACPVLLSTAKLRAPSARPSQHPLGTHCPNMRSLPHTLSCCLYDRDAQAAR